MRNEKQRIEVVQMTRTNNPVLDAEVYQQELETMNRHSIASRRAQAYREAEYKEDEDERENY